jgi:hypothetical protein
MLLPVVLGNERPITPTPPRGKDPRAVDLSSVGPFAIRFTHSYVVSSTSIKRLKTANNGRH